MAADPDLSVGKGILGIVGRISSRRNRRIKVTPSVEE
jgi:hypothetical protein